MNNFTEGDKVDFRGDEMIFLIMFRGDAILINGSGIPKRVLIEAVSAVKTGTEKAISDIRKVDQAVHDMCNFEECFLDAIKAGKIHGVTWSGK